MESKRDIKALTLEELKAEMVRLGEAPFRARQLYRWMHVQLATDFEQMNNLSKALREKARGNFDYVTADLVQMQESAIDGTRKYLFAFAGGALVESVWMKYKHGNSVCISSQAGCRMGCRFCASTLNGLDRSLTASEMLEQVYAVTRLTGERVSHVVVMGIGEPLDNYENLLRFIRLLTDENGLHISQRNVTVSTCGLAPEIRRLAQEGLQITLALSLHAATDEKRRQLMPIAEKYSIAEVLAACAFYFEKTGRRITFEYALAEGVNDSKEDAEQLGRLLRHVNCHVNLIPINPVRERAFRKAKTEAVAAFKERLEKNGITVTVRRSLGSDIDGACGQLRGKQEINNGKQR